MKERVVIIAPHHDDESLGCGGLIATGRYEAHIIVVCDAPSKAGQLKRAVNILKARGLIELHHKARQLDATPMAGLVGDLKKAIDSVKPVTVFTPYRNDAHSDHRIVTAAVMAACKPFRSEVRNIIEYETISETNLAGEPFCPNWFCELSHAELHEKIAAVSSYEQDCKVRVRSGREVEALSIYRGSQINRLYAEAYRVERMLA